MANDPRDAIWNEAHLLAYNARYTGEVEKTLLARWTWLDSVTKIAVAISAGGGALTGLALWQNSDYTFLWPLFTSISTLLAVISKQLFVAEKIKRHATTATCMSALAISVESLILRMKVNPEFSIAEFEKKLLTFRDKYGSEYSKLPHDLLLTEKVRTRVQQRLNKAIENEAKGAHS